MLLLALGLHVAKYVQVCALTYTVSVCDEVVDIKLRQAPACSLHHSLKSIKSMVPATDLLGGRGELEELLSGHKPGPSDFPRR